MKFYSNSRPQIIRARINQKIRTRVLIEIVSLGYHSCQLSETRGNIISEQQQKIK